MENNKNSSLEMASKLVQQTKKVESIVYVQREALSMIQDPGKVEVNILYMGRYMR